MYWLERLNQYINKNNLSAFEHKCISIGTVSEFVWYVVLIDVLLGASTYDILFLLTYDLLFWLNTLSSYDVILLIYWLEQVRMFIIFININIWYMILIIVLIHILDAYLI